jgi:hypothetical protein
VPLDKGCMGRGGTGRWARHTAPHHPKLRLRHPTHKPMGPRPPIGHLCVPHRGLRHGDDTQQLLQAAALCKYVSIVVGVGARGQGAVKRGWAAASQRGG